jgi:hypothetical protein
MTVTEATTRTLDAPGAALTFVFPSGHGGFLGGEYGHSGDPDAFAAKRPDVLEER